MDTQKPLQPTNEQTVIKATYFSILANMGMVIVKGLTGYFGNSHALIADAIESMGDVCSSMLVLFGFKYANKPADKDHPYGHGRAEPLVTFIVVGLLIASAIVIAYQSIQNIKTPHLGPEPYTLIVLGIIIIWKEVSFRFINHKSEQTKSSSLKADAWHHRSDALTSIAAFIGISIALFFGKGYESADDWAALIAAVFILYNSYFIFRPALGEIMDEHLYDDLIKEISKVSHQVAGIINTEKCLIRKSGMIYHVELHITIDGNMTVKAGHELAHQLEAELHQQIGQLGHILIHVEPDE